MGIDFVTLALAKKYADSKTGQGSGVSVQPDWNQNDESRLDYVKNRTHYEKEIKTALRENAVTVNCDKSGFSGTYGDYYYKDLYAYWLGGWDYLVGKTIKIVFDGKSYDVLISSRDTMADLNNYPFEVYLVRDYTRFGAREPGVHTFEFYLIEQELKQLDPKYIKDMYYESEPVEIEIQPESIVENLDGYVIWDNLIHTMLQEGRTYIVTWNGEKYRCVARNVNNNIYIGNQALAEAADGWGFPEVIESSEPFFIATIEFDMWSVVIAESGTHTFSINVLESVIHQIHPKYIADMYYDNGITVTEVVPETTVEGFENTKGPFYGAMNAISIVPVIGATYTVVWDGVEYNIECNVADGLAYIGNENYVFMTTGGDIPFAIIFVDFGTFLVTESDAPSHTISVTEIAHDLKQLDIKYLSILEKATEIVFEADSVVNDSEFVGSEYKKLLGEYTVTIDGIPKNVEFVNDGDWSFVEDELFYIKTWGAGIYFSFLDDEPHSVKIEGIKNVIKEEYLPDSVKAQPDWNQNEPNDAGYIKNRTHYDVETQTLLKEEVTVECTETYEGYYQGRRYAYMLGGWAPFIGKTIRVIFNGTPYDIFVKHDQNLGDLDIYPFFLWYSGDWTFFCVKEAGTYTFELYLVERDFKQLDPKYIKDMYYEKGIIASLSDGDSFNWEKDKPYTLRVDGVVYEFDSMYMGDYHNASGNYIWSLGATPRVSGTSINVEIWDYPFSVYAVGYGEPKPTTALKFEDGTFNHTVEVLEDYELHQIDPKYIPQPDWNQYDPNGAGYIKNRPFYEIPAYHIGALTLSATSADTLKYSFIEADNDVLKYLYNNLNGKGEVLEVIIDGNHYICSAQGDRGFVGFDGDLGGQLRWTVNYETSVIINNNGNLIAGNEYEVNFYDASTYDIHQLDEKYLPDSVKPFMVNFEQSVTENENGEIEYVISADKTFIEILEALNSGMDVYAVSNGIKVAATYWDDGMVEFTHVSRSPHGPFLETNLSALVGTPGDDSDVWQIFGNDYILADNRPIHINVDYFEGELSYSLNAPVEVIDEALRCGRIPDIYLASESELIRCISVAPGDDYFTLGFYSVMEGAAIKLMLHADGSVTKWIPM